MLPVRAAIGGRTQRNNTEEHERRPRRGLNTTSWRRKSDSQVFTNKSDKSEADADLRLLHCKPLLRSTSNRTRLSASARDFPRWIGSHLGHSRGTRAAHNRTGVAVSPAGASEGKWCENLPLHRTFIQRR